MRVQELIEKRAKVWETAKNFVDTHEDKNGNLSAEDKETYSRMEAEIEKLTNSIERQQRAERREQALFKPVNSAITGKPYKDGPQGEVKTGRASDEYKKAMLTALRFNFRQVSNVLQEGVDADGGYLVPEEYDHRLIDVLTEENIMRGMHWEHRFNSMVGRYNEIYKMQIPNITPHVCRHTYCSNQAKDGMNPKTLQYLMGHSDIAVTLNVYTHVALEDAENELRKMQTLEGARKEMGQSFFLWV